MSNFHGYESATRCSGAEASGTRQLLSAFITHYDHRGVYSMGIYNCRPPRGGVGWSIHAEGRALDLAVGVGGKELGDELLEGLLSTPWELGLQRIIWWDRLYDLGTPGGRPYSGEDPHHSHLHIEQTREAGATLVYSVAWQTIKDWGDEMALTEDQVAAIVRRVLAEGKGYGQQSWPSTVQATLRIVQGLTNAVSALELLVQELLDLAGPTDRPAAPGAAATPTETVDDVSGPAGGAADGPDARTQGPADPSSYPQADGPM